MQSSSSVRRRRAEVPTPNAFSPAAAAAQRQMQPPPPRGPGGPQIPNNNPAASAMNAATIAQQRARMAAMAAANSANPVPGMNSPMPVPGPGNPYRMVGQTPPSAFPYNPQQMQQQPTQSPGAPITGPIHSFADPNMDPMSASNPGGRQRYSYTPQSQHPQPPFASPTSTPMFRGSDHDMGIAPTTTGISTPIPPALPSFTEAANEQTEKRNTEPTVPLSLYTSLQELLATTQQRVAVLETEIQHLTSHVNTLSTQLTTVQNTASAAAAATAAPQISIPTELTQDMAEIKHGMAKTHTFLLDIVTELMRNRTSPISATESPAVPVHPPTAATVVQLPEESTEDDRKETQENTTPSTDHVPQEHIETTSPSFEPDTSVAIPASASDEPDAIHQLENLVENIIGNQTSQA